MKFTQAALVALALLNGLFAHSVTANFVDWDKGGGNNSWGTATNWNPDITPGPGDTIMLTGTLVTGPQVIDLGSLTRSIEEIQMVGANDSYTFTNGTLGILSAGDGLLHSSGTGALQVDADLELAVTNTIVRFNVWSGAGPIIVNGDIESSAASGTTMLELTSRDLSQDPSVQVTGVISDGNSGQYYH